MSFSSLYVKVGKQGSEIFLTRVLLTLFSLSGSIVLVRNWGIDSKGEYTLLFSTVAIVYFIVSLGTYYAVFHFLNKSLNNFHQIINLIFRHYLIASAVVFFVGYFFDWVGTEILGFTTITNLKYLFPLSILSVSLTNLMETFYTSASLIRKLSIYRVVRSFTQNSIVLLIVFSIPPNLNILIYFFVSSELLITILFLFTTQLSQKKEKNKKFNIKNFYQFSFFSMPQSTLPLTTNNLFPFIVANFLGLEALGVLSIANSFSNFITMFLKTVINLMQRELTKLKNSTKKLLIKDALKIHLALFIVIAFLFSLSVGFLVNHLFGIDDRKVNIVCLCVLLFNYPITLQGLINSYFMSAERPIFVSLVNIITALMIIVLAVTFLSSIGLALTIILIGTGRLIIAIIYLIVSLRTHLPETGAP